MSEESLAKFDGHDFRPWKRRTEEVRLSSEFVQLPENSDQSPLYCGFWKRFFAHTIDCFAMASLGGMVCFEFGASLPVTFIAAQHVAVLFGYFGLILWFICDFVPGIGLIACLMSLGNWCYYAMFGNVHVANFAENWMLIGCAPFVFDLLYRSICESSPTRATIGKRLMRIYVADRSGNRLTFLQALHRSLAKSLLIPAFVLRPISSMWIKRKQSHYDALVDTVVLKNAVKMDQLKLLR